VTTADKIRSFADLAPGWLNGSGVPLCPEMIALALLVEKAFRDMGFPLTGAFPGGDGDCEIRGYHLNGSGMGAWLTKEDFRSAAVASDVPFCDVCQAFRPIGHYCD